MKTNKVKVGQVWQDWDPRFRSIKSTPAPFRCRIEIEIRIEDGKESRA